MSDPNTDDDNEKKPSPELEQKNLKCGKSLRKLKHRAQKYRTAWENDPRFKAWLIRAPESSKARCRACNTDLTSELVVLKNHARSARHLLKISESSDEIEPDLESQTKLAEMKLKEFIKKHKIPSDCVDHLIKVIKAILPDSRIAQQIRLDKFKQ